MSRFSKIWLPRTLCVLAVGTLAFGNVGCSSGTSDGSPPPGTIDGGGTPGTPGHRGGTIGRNIATEQAKSAGLSMPGSHTQQVRVKTGRRTLSAPTFTADQEQQMLNNMILLFNNASPDQVVYSLNNVIFMTTDEFEAFLGALTPQQSAQLWQSVTPDKLRAVFGQMTPDDQTAWQGYWQELAAKGLAPQVSA